MKSWHELLITCSQEILNKNWVGVQYLTLFLGKFDFKLLFIFFNKLYVAASGSLKCYESVNNGLGDEVICKDSTAVSILGDGDGPFKCAKVTTS